MLLTHSLSTRKFLVSIPSKENLELLAAIKRLKKLDVIESDVDVARLMSEAGFNVTRGTLSSYKNGPHNPSKNFVLKFNELFGKHGVTLGTDEVLKVKAESTTDIQIPGSRPFLGTMDVFAGTPEILFNDVKEYVTDYIFVPDLKDVDYWITVYGDSMYPKFKNGTRIAIKNVPNYNDYIVFGQPYFIATTQHRLLKFIRKSKLRGHWTLCSENPKYDEFDVPIKDVISVWKVRAKIDIDDM